jgi:hypothetical protein
MLKKSSPLKLLGQMEPNLAGSIYVRSSIKLLHLVPFGQQTWPLLLLPLAAIFVGGMGRNEETLKRTLYRCFLPSLVPFGPVVSEE